MLYVSVHWKISLQYFPITHQLCTELVLHYFTVYEMQFGVPETAFFLELPHYIQPQINSMYSSTCGLYNVILKSTELVA